MTYEESDYVMGRWFDTVVGRPPSRLLSAAHFSELEEVLTWVGRDVGLSIVPRDAAAGALRAGTVALVGMPGRRCFNQVYMVTRAGAALRPELRRLAALVRPVGPA